MKNLIKSQEINKKLNNLDKETIESWKVLKNLSVLSIKETLEKLNHNFDLWLGESDVNHLIPDLLKSKRKKKIIEDDGAYISAMDSDKYNNQIRWFIFIFNDRPCNS